ncbi:MAG: NAD(P)H-hydrate dehydratase [Ruminococcus sp.]|nr:NAD(P)H-hydrate dehydratase [Ruminococcus sp.]
MQILSPEQMKQTEERSEELGVTKKKLMENAGTALAGIIDEYCRSEIEGQPEEKSVVFLTGSGNNGGDCFVAADKLVYRGYDVTVINLCGRPQSELAASAFEKLPRNHMKIIKGYRSENVKAAIEAAELDYMTLSQENDLNTLSEKKELTPLEKIRLEEKHRIDRVVKALEDADVIADGIFGTGFHGQLDEEIAAFLSAGDKAYRIAVDVPSGGNCTTGEVSEGTFNADETVAFGALKTGMTQYPLKAYCGKIRIADIGIPAEAYTIPDGEREYSLTDSYSLAGFPVDRNPDSHKGDYGRLFAIAGSSRMRGAAALATMGALRSGVGLMCLASGEECINTVAQHAPESFYLPLETDDYGFVLFDSNKRMIEHEMKKANAILLGSGMGVTNDTLELVRFVVEKAECPIIIDADGINCIASDIDILLKKKTDIILTPHMGEMARLLDKTPDEIKENRFAAAAEFAEKHNVTVVLKGPGTIIADASCTSINITGNAGMARGGSGDVLAGIIAALATQGYAPYDAARYGVYVHGLAGDIAAERLGFEAMLPRDIIDCLSDSYRMIKDMDKK